MNLSKYLPFLKDAGERLVKAFAGGFIVGAGLLSVVAAVATGDFSVAASTIDWLHGFDVGAGTSVVSALFSLASLKVGNPGTASLTTAVTLSEPPPPHTAS